MDEKVLRQAGYVPLAEFDDRHRRSNDAHAPGYKALKKAIEKGDKAIPSAQIPAAKYGRFWVHKASAEQFLSKAEAALHEAASRALADRGDCEGISSPRDETQQFVTFIEAVLAMLERLTTAVENIATQPTGTNAHDRLVATVESNGFHN